MRAGAMTASEITSRAADKISPLFGRKSPRCTFFHQSTPATTYWRITLPARYLPGKVVAAHEVLVRHFEKQQKLTFPQLRGNAAIIQYPGDNGSALFAMAMESAGNKLLVEVDDNYAAYSDELWMKRASWGRAIRGDLATSVQGHRWIVEHAYGVIVTTRALAQEYEKLNENVTICRNSIDPSDWPNPARKDDLFRIGWYASNSHDRDGVMIAKALSWASRQPNIEIVNIGFDPGWRFARRQIGWTDNFLAQRKELCRLDVGVSPLVMSPLAKYRSDLKALEYAMGGAMPLLQSSEPYWEWEDKPFARICHTPGDWLKAIKWAVANRDEVRWRAEQARDYVLRERTIQGETSKWKEALDS